MTTGLRRRKRAVWLWVAAAAAVAVLFTFVLRCTAVLPEKTYTAADFGLVNRHSRTDYNENGLDDYTDFVLGARLDAEKHPKYDGRYWEGGYPPENVGVCTDVIWRAFRQAGYSLRAMVAADIRRRPEAYPEAVPPDDNIDFRRVKNLRVFFEEYGSSQTLDLDAIAEWQPGDIVIFGADTHIGLVSDRRDKKGRPYILHNTGQARREEDYLAWAVPTGHYRFDASALDAALLLPWDG